MRYRLQVLLILLAIALVGITSLYPIGYFVLCERCEDSRLVFLTFPSKWLHDIYLPAARIERRLRPTRDVWIGHREP